MKKILFIIFCATFLLVSCTSITEYNSKSIFVFDTVINMRFYNAENPDKHYEDIKKMLKENHPLVVAGISIAEVNEAENQRDNSYNKLKNLNTISLTTDDEFKILLKDLVKVLDEDFAENFGADGNKIDNVWRSVGNKYR